MSRKNFVFNAPLSKSIFGGENGVLTPTAAATDLLFVKSVNISGGWGFATEDLPVIAATEGLSVIAATEGLPDIAATEVAATEVAATEVGGNKFVATEVGGNKFVAGGNKFVVIDVVACEGGYGGGGGGGLDFTGINVCVGAKF